MPSRRISGSSLSRETTVEGSGRMSPPSRVPGAVMWHIIPPAKLTGAYFRRLSYNVGVSQRLRAEIHRRLPKTFVLEIAKWAATLVLCCTMPPRKSRWLLRMRLEISRGLFTKIKN